MLTIFQKNVPIESMSASYWYVYNIYIHLLNNLYSVCHIECAFNFNSQKYNFTVVLRDVTHKAMRGLLQFMYHGEVSVKKEDLTSFIGTAEVLQIKGLTTKEVSK